jgi:S1-C subfamily serine protease
MDLAIIDFNQDVFAHKACIPLADGSVLDEVLTLGYPDVPGFHPTVAAEKANISSRLTATRGAIASTPAELWTRSEVFLITARVRGGFSGGPVLDPTGQCVGVVSREPASYALELGSHRYDNLGYGTAIPATALISMQEQIAAGDLAPTPMGDVEMSDFE